MRRIASISLVSVLALSLVACGGAAEDDGEAGNEQPDPMAELSSIQKANFERFNRDDFQANLQGIVSELKEGEGPEDGMDFAYLDQNDDEKLSPAEYAVWKLSEQSVALENASTLSDEQTDEILIPFFQHDLDGDISLSEVEFAAVSGQPAPEQPEETPEAEG